jgi:replicative DNA helicase
MKLSAPIFRLKRLARDTARERSIPLHAALDGIAAQQGFSSWSLLAARHAGQSQAARLLAELQAGELVLLAARPQQGKTLLALQLALEAASAGRKAHIFTLDYTRRDVIERLSQLGANPAQVSAALAIDCSDAICASHIMAAMGEAPAGTLAVVDYLQLLDQKRDNPPLQDQIEALSHFARQRGLILVFISQVDRAFDAALAPCPTLSDIRLPNPLDLTLFGKAVLLHAGELQLAST